MGDVFFTDAAVLGDAPVSDSTGAVILAVKLGTVFVVGVIGSDPVGGVGILVVSAIDTTISVVLDSII